MAKLEHHCCTHRLYNQRADTDLIFCLLIDAEHAAADGDLRRATHHCLDCLEWQGHRAP